MIWTTPTHSFAATLCRKTGLPCPMAARLAQSLSDALRKAEPVTQPGFELTGTTSLKGCTDGCTARYVAGHTRIRLFCGVPDTADQPPLDRLADAMFGDGGPVPPMRTPVPDAMVEALPLRPARSKQAAGQEHPAA